MTEALKSKFKTEFRAIKTPVFLAGLDKPSKPQLTVHVKAEARNGYLSSHVKRAAQNVFHAPIPVKIQPWKPEDFERPETLEDVVSKLNHDLVVHDPTGAYDRARRILSFSTRLRSQLSRDIAGIFFAPDAGSLVIVLDSSRYVDSRALRLKQLCETEKTVYAAIGAAFADRLDEVPPLRIGFGFPETPVVAVDRASQLNGRGQLRWLRLKKTAMAALMATGFTISQTAHAATDTPAVSGTNTQITGAFADNYGESGGAASFSLAAPWGDKGGVQLDAAAGYAGGDFSGIAAQVFMRNPDKYLLGLLASYGQYDGEDASRIGAKGEIYLSQFTLAAQAGAQFSDSFGDGGYGKVDLGWYATDNFYMSVGGDFSDDADVGVVAVEYRPGFEAYNGLSFFAEGTFGGNDSAVMIGFKSQYYGSSTLKERDRKDMTQNEAFNVLRAVAAMKDQSGYGGFTGTDTGGGGFTPPAT